MVLFVRVSSDWKAFAFLHEVPVEFCRRKAVEWTQCKPQQPTEVSRASVSKLYNLPIVYLIGLRPRIRSLLVSKPILSASSAHVEVAVGLLLQPTLAL